jgi:hypothetical protein
MRKKILYMLFGFCMFMVLSFGCKFVKAAERPDPVVYIGYLYEIPDSPKAINAVHNEQIKRFHARKIVQIFSVKRAASLGQQEDFRAALKELENAWPLFANLKFGKGDGNPQPKELNILNIELQHSIGLQFLMDLVARQP